MINTGCFLAYPIISYKALLYASSVFCFCLLYSFVILSENIIILCGVPFAWFVYDVIGERFKNKFDLGKEMKLAKYGIFIYFFHIVIYYIW